VPEPPEEAYGRVTNPERYEAVQAAAASLIRELVASFDVEVLRGLDADPVFVQRWSNIVPGSVVRLVPRARNAAAVTFAFTTLPGVILRIGQWRIATYPRCGCDACDEHPDEVIEQLRNDIDAVTAGGLAEAWDGTRLHVSTAYSDGSTSRGWSLVEVDQHLYGDPAEHTWGPWVGVQS